MKSQHDDAWPDGLQLLQPNPAADPPEFGPMWQAAETRLAGRRRARRIGWAAACLVAILATTWARWGPTQMAGVTPEIDFQRLQREVEQNLGETQFVWNSPTDFLVTLEHDDPLKWAAGGAELKLLETLIN